MGAIAITDLVKSTLGPKGMVRHDVSVVWLCMCLVHCCVVCLCVCVFCWCHETACKVAVGLESGWRERQLEDAHRRLPDYAAAAFIPSRRTDRLKQPRNTLP